MERDEALIEAVREYLCLYNSRPPDFKVQIKKENVWSNISQVLERTGELHVMCIYCTLHT